ncbi:phosphotransferase [Nonomuraea sp. ZG12]|uniref:phosphotransferase n=1 Tax=Nonomuraea sp. ZG12 TaxID=3452207 RepID=UPI003F89E03A
MVNDRVVVKWLTPPVPLPRTPEVLAHLVDAGFKDTAPPYAALTRVDGPHEILLALVTGYLPEATDGWEWCADDAQAGRTAFAPALGRLAADLHLALSTFPTEPASPAEPGPRAEPGTGGPFPGASFPSASFPGEDGVRAESALREALELTGGDDGAWLAGHAGRLREELAPLARPVASPRIRIHGDLHVGQILRWRDGYAVIDFDGNPTVTGADPLQPAARDVAQLTTSLQHVAQVAIKRRGTPPESAAHWAAEARALMLAAYTGRLAERGAAGLLDESLIRPFEIEQECRELIYAARHLPRWRYAPMGVLRDWYPEESR